MAVVAGFCQGGEMCFSLQEISIAAIYEKTEKKQSVVAERKAI